MKNFLLSQKYSIPPTSQAYFLLLLDCTREKSESIHPGHFCSTIRIPVQRGV